MTDIKIDDLSKPVTQAEIEERLKGLTPEQLEAARQQQIDAAILNPKVDADPDWSRMGDGEFLKERMKRYGF
jgi:hypothetical protein